MNLLATDPETGFLNNPFSLEIDHRRNDAQSCIRP